MKEKQEVPKVLRFWWRGTAICFPFSSNKKVAIPIQCSTMFSCDSQPHTLFRKQAQCLQFVFFSKIILDVLQGQSNCPIHMPPLARVCSAVVYESYPFRFGQVGG